MIEFETRVLEVIQRTPNVKSFRFKALKEVDFKPGQFFFITIKINGEENTKHFSFSNSPTEKGYLEFTKRLTDSDFSKALNNLKTGDWARLRLPYGNFVFENKYKKIAFLTGGIGITPVRSICRYVFDKKLKTDVILLYGNNTEKDIIFRNDFDLMQNQKGESKFRIVYTLTSPEVDLKSWHGRAGFITKEMIREEIPDYRDRIFFVCGPPGMVEELINILKDELNLPKEKIIIEKFPGY